MKKHTPFRLFLVVNVVLMQILSAQTPFTIEAVRHDIAPIIDGDINDSVWDNAALAQNFIQYEPKWGQPSGARTSVRVLYDDQYLYFAFEMEEGNDIISQLTNRDSDLENDDAVIVILDTYHDKQSAYYFSTNMLGTQADGTIINDGKSKDESWDGKWISEARRTDTGWSAEIAIPFATLKYQSQKIQNWGINFGRSRPRNRERSYWSIPDMNAFQVSQAGLLSNLNVTRPDKKIRLIGYGLGVIDQTNNVEADLGLDVLYKFTPQVYGYATINPDFATVEADEAEINLTKYELSLKEKRPFFIEGNELYGQRIKTFYSRRIDDIAGGARILGRTGDYTFSGLSAITKNDSDLVSYSVGRLQRNIFESSNISLMNSNKRSQNSNEGSLGIDANLIFNDELSMTTQFSNSYGSHDTGNMAYFFRPSYDTPTGHFHIRYTNLGEYFSENVNGIGYVKDDDRKEFDSALEREIWIREFNIDKLNYESNYNIFWSQAGTLRSWEVKQSLGIELTNRFSLEYDYEEGYELDDEREFNNISNGFEFGYNKDEFKSIIVNYETGKNYGLDFDLVECEIGYIFTTSFSAQYGLQSIHFAPDPENENSQIHLLRVNQFFTKDIYLKGFYQLNTSSEQQDIQIIFVYRYEPPFGTVQFVYQHNPANSFQNTEEDHSIFLKYSRVL
ncbi:MAG: carbohydrate binding family 9 domain-containing protein [Candidatus Marinimicrobia bacterium]|nr:carbohydrate binding family 9 domain-containing protein [Candidatus Neomarinimicrobiota bacterium]MBT3630419.1 carbohydrate binding family 9 domain-containing protein [Candidatus Neomarinimicrobiota bacterium]MBT3823738.1 carbohydrate binding family 9 domain-containing protein [Candidatus Neomarinimicrobiota bacterium]MBT4131913.1 carbohydrate binding family 9 domain-containing protein [Candidatus Neomarinimicrobiota bacterium]MBT4294639.1 carbohydrate binding family 9 domain-containing prot